MSTTIPYRSLWKTALLTSPLLAFAFASPILIASGLGIGLIWMVIPGGMAVCLIAWTLNIGFLRYRERLGKWRGLQVLIIGGLMIGVSSLAFYLVGDRLPENALRLGAIRYINALAVNTIIYILIDIRLLSQTQAKLVEENAQLRLSSLETQYQMLKDQINPHFLFNALATARSLARRDPALTEAYIIRLSDFLRVTLQDNRDEVALADELRLVRDYVELQQMRFHEALVYTCAPEVVAGQFQLPYFSLLTLVENAVKHNAMTAEAPLNIEIMLSGNRITVRNNRQPKALHSPSNGSGLSNLQKRCKMLGHGEIDVVETKEDYAVTLNLLPL
jgi:two-component system, LytTR family, sensor kinase